IGRDDILNTTETTLKTLVAKDGCILSYSCLARYLAMGADYKAEGEKVQGLIKNARYHFACSSGEICPLPDASGRLKNYFHNYTNVFCRIS
ncbi:MAG: hypothetical protein FWC45_06385, partial [Treponema sp.]|nr:hypothetical protein [Treponema sp.]